MRTALSVVSQLSNPTLHTSGQVAPRALGVAEFLSWPWSEFTSPRSRLRFVDPSNSYNFWPFKKKAKLQVQNQVQGLMKGLFQKKSLKLKPTFAINPLSPLAVFSPHEKIFVGSCLVVGSKAGLNFPGTQRCLIFAFQAQGGNWKSQSEK